MEDLKWLDSKAGKWSFSDVLSKIVEVAQLYGITVLLVNAKNTSHTDPFTKERINPNSQRKVRTQAGVLDRDNCAALEIGTRRGRGIRKSKISDKRKKNERTIVPGKTRDKHHSTPKRPKLTRRKTAYKLMKKKNLSSSDFTYDSGVSIAVASSDAVSPSTLHIPTSCGIVINSKNTL